MAKRDKTRQVRELSIEQLNAIEMLIAGSSDAQAAEAIGVSRQTVCDWRNNDTEFRYALERRRKDVWCNQEDTLRAMVSRALSVLEANLSSQDEHIRQAAAVHVLRSVGLYGQALKPRGATSAESLLNFDFDNM